MADIRFLPGIILVSLLLNSCLSLSYDLTLSANGSGTLLYQGSISTLAADLESTNGGDKIVYYPLMSDKADQAAAASGGARIISWDMTDDGSRYHIKGSIGFSSLDSLAAFAGIGLASERIGADTKLSFTIYRADVNNPVDSRILDIVKNSFPDDFIEIKVHIPGDIIQVNGATFSGSTVTFRTTLLKMLQDDRDVIFTAEYR